MNLNIVLGVCLTKFLWNLTSDLYLQVTFGEIQTCLRFLADAQGSSERSITWRCTMLRISLVCCLSCHQHQTLIFFPLARSLHCSIIPLQFANDHQARAVTPVLLSRGYRKQEGDQCECECQEEEKGQLKEQFKHKIPEAEKLKFPAKLLVA